MKYYKKDNKIYGYADNQLYLVTDDMIELSPLEIDKIINPQNHLSVSEIENSRLDNMPPLTRRQFMRTLVLQGYDLDFIEGEINKIEDKPTRQLALIDWKESTEFQRTNSTLIMMATMLGLSSEQIDTMWQFALTL